jgi:hypothetical protein
MPIPRAFLLILEALVRPQLDLCYMLILPPRHVGMS